MEPSVIGRIFAGETAGRLESALRFTEKRHRILVENIANVDTPGYKRKDISLRSFQAAMGRLDQGEVARAPGRGGGVPSDSSGFESIRSGPDASGMVRQDGNNVSVEFEMAELASNALLHNTLAALVAKKYRGIEMAISGRIGTA